METEGGNYLNVTLKNKILSKETILTYLEKNNYKNQKNQERIKNSLISKSFKVKYAKRNYIIDDISFDRNPNNTNFINFEGETILLKKYYLERHNIKIENLEQPLLIVKVKGPQDKEISLYFIPELCYFAGLDDEATKDGYFMKQLANETKLKPEDRIFKTEKFLQLLVETKKKNPNDPNEKSSKEKSELYGIEVEPLKTMHKAYYMEETNLKAKNGSINLKNDKIFEVSKNVDFYNWVCFYKKENYNDADKFYKGLQKAGSGYGIDIEEPIWVEMDNNVNDKNWISEADKKFKNANKSKKKYLFAVFLINKNDSIYPKIKKHSLCTNGYISQIVKVNSLYKKNKGQKINYKTPVDLSVCSKIILQINAKLSGVTYEVKFPKEIQDRKLMVIGVDSSHIRGERTGVAMVATINKNYTKFYNKELIYEEKNKERIQFSISSFIKDALLSYKNEMKELPLGIVIYRQGVSLQQKDFLVGEVNNIKKELNEKIKFYYILVNTKTTYKFFEKNGKSYSNPSEGLLVLDGVTNKNFFEFYIQPQQVTGGSATPSCFHVAYGDLDFPEMIPKFTFDLCHLYSNWQGTVRVPHVLKAAEKLSKMTAKYTLEELNENLNVGQSYL